MKSEHIHSYFQLIGQQRAAFNQELVETVKDPWERPLPDKWSVGETIYHLMLMTRLLKRFSIFYLPIMIPYAHLRKKRPFKTEIHNIYDEYNQVKKRSMKAPFLIIPPNNLSQKFHFAEVQQLLNNETTELMAIFSKLDEQVAGQIKYPDPIAYYPNIIQSVYILALHEQHHFNLLRKYMKHTK